MHFGSSVLDLGLTPRLSPECIGLAPDCIGLALECIGLAPESTVAECTAIPFRQLPNKMPNCLSLCGLKAIHRAFIVAIMIVAIGNHDCGNHMIAKMIAAITRQSKSDCR